MPARLVSNGDGLDAVIGAGEAAIHLPVPRMTPPDWAGREVILGIRPECIAEASRQFGDATDRAVSITVPVQMVEPTGAENIVLMDFGPHRVLGRTAPDAAVRTGAPATFAVDTRNICLFDTETERLIA